MRELNDGRSLGIDGNRSFGVLWLLSHWFIRKLAGRAPGVGRRAELVSSKRKPAR